jgi:hypothetical protein
MKIIKESDFGESLTYSRCFHFNDSPGCGFSFPCDEKGEISISKHQRGRDNLAACLTGKVNGKPVTDDGIETYRTRWKDYALGLCDCGCEVELSGFTNTCDCGRDYNMSGQLLAPRSQWGEETGEHPADIARIK